MPVNRIVFFFFLYSRQKYSGENQWRCSRFSSPNANYRPRNSCTSTAESSKIPNIILSVGLDLRYDFGFYNDEQTTRRVYSDTAVQDLLGEHSFFRYPFMNKFENLSRFRFVVRYFRKNRMEKKKKDIITQFVIIIFPWRVYRGVFFFYIFFRYRRKPYVLLLNNIIISCQFYFGDRTRYAFVHEVFNLAPLKTKPPTAFSITRILNARHKLTFFRF